MTKWDHRFYEQALLVASWSKDPSTKVGAVITDTLNRKVSEGFNGFPRGIEDTYLRLNMRELKYKLTLHAEDNAILFARRDLEGCRIYSTLFPCGPCAARIIQVGITEVFAPEQKIDRWKNDSDLALEMFKEAHVKVTYVTKELT